MPPLAPCRLSTTMFWLRAMPSGWAMMRVTMSVPLPAPNGTMMVMGRLGYASAAAAAHEKAAMPIASAPPARTIRSRSRILPLGALGVAIVRRLHAREKEQQRDRERPNNRADPPPGLER